tara:strand:+ start:559 stop:1005 length:447 start_codon:yes stop_codon:yes gene_type:complete
MLMAILVSEIFRSKVEFSINVKEVKITKGTVITLNKLIIAVSEIERATSPLANEVSIFDVTPPGAAAIIITPMASSGDIGHIFTKIKAIIGSKIICDIKPIKKSLGCFITLKKSCPVKPKPRLNIINAKANGKTKSVTIFIISILSIF